MTLTKTEARDKQKPKNIRTFTQNETRDKQKPKNTMTINKKQSQCSKTTKIANDIQ